MAFLRSSLALLCLLLGVLASQPAWSLSIFGTGAQTEAADLPVFDPTDYELGTFFQSSVAGDVIALRVYLGPVEAADPGIIVGTLWNASGSVLGSATFTNVSAGWNEVALAVPVSIAADTTYVVSANTNAGTTGTGSYAADKGPGDLGFFGGGGYANGPLTATSGVFNTTPGAFPTTNFPTTNGGSSYFRDVQFVPEPATALLLGLGLATVCLASERRRLP